MTYRNHVLAWEAAGSPTGVCACCKQWRRLGLDRCSVTPNNACQ